MSKIQTVFKVTGTEIKHISINNSQTNSVEGSHSITFVYIYSF